MILPDSGHKTLKKVETKVLRRARLAASIGWLSYPLYKYVCPYRQSIAAVDNDPEEDSNNTLLMGSIEIEAVGKPTTY